MSVTIAGIEFDHHGAVIGMMLVNVRLLLERDGELKITWAEAHSVGSSSPHRPPLPRDGQSLRQPPSSSSSRGRRNRHVRPPSRKVSSPRQFVDRRDRHLQQVCDLLLRHHFVSRQAQHRRQNRGLPGLPKGVSRTLTPS
jgi:hypothetical protein